MSESIQVNGNFAVKVGLRWACKQYSDDVSLYAQPKSLMDFKTALALAQEIGGDMYIFRPEPLTKEKIEELQLAAAVVE